MIDARKKPNGYDYGDPLFSISYLNQRLLTRPVLKTHIRYVYRN
jgi:hypothetical protein